MRSISTSVYDQCESGEKITTLTIQTNIRIVHSLLIACYPHTMSTSASSPPVPTACRTADDPQPNHATQRANLVNPELPISIMSIKSICASTFPPRLKKSEISLDAVGINCPVHERGSLNGSRHSLPTPGTSIVNGSQILCEVIRATLSSPNQRNWSFPNPTTNFAGSY